jgi:hypothetical protein
LVETFEPGNIPAGYRETVSLKMPEKGDVVVIYLDIRGGGSGAFGFDWGSLSPGTLLTQEGPNPVPVAGLRHRWLWWYLNVASMSGAS